MYSNQTFSPCSCTLEWRRPIQAYSYLGRSTGGFPAHISVTSFKSLFSKSCWIILFLNSQINRAISTCISTAASVLTEINTSACLPGMQEGKFPSPKALTNTHLLCSVSDTWGQAKPCCDCHSSAVAMYNALYIVHNRPYTCPKLTQRGCVTDPKPGIGLCWGKGIPSALLLPGQKDRIQMLYGEESPFATFLIVNQYLSCTHSRKVSILGDTSALYAIAYCLNIQHSETTYLLSLSKQSKMEHAVMQLKEQPEAYQRD